MVMAQYKDTQYVAHEFVRQYYTILHKDPRQLHRFYTKESRLTHGTSPNFKSEEQPVCGQEAINEKIQQLNFQNCCAKIRSVDSHPTLSGGVVIQVNGELANSGLGYRKFMQTFVLGQQEPKKYHVVNDIFRYQDETFEDTENDDTLDVESENGYQSYEPAVNAGESVEVVDAVNKEPLITNSKPLETENEFAYSNYMHQEKNEQMNGDIHEEQEIEKHVEPAEQEVPVQEEEPEVLPEQEVAQETAPEEQAAEEPAESEEASVEPVSQPEEIKVQAPVEPVVPSKPVSWAALAKKNTPTPIATSVPVSKPAPKKPTPVVQKTVPKKREETQAAAPPKKEPSEEPRRRNAAPDNHQIFIGSLPANITEKDVRDVFDEYGNIVEIRLNPKNFGFIAFDGPEAPAKILAKPKNISILGNTINIEVKRSGGGGPGRDRGGDRGGGGFRRGGSDKEGRGERRGESGGGRSEFNRNKNGGQFNRPGKNTFGGQKQKSGEDGKNESKGQKDQKPRDQTKPARR